MLIRRLLFKREYYADFIQILTILLFSFGNLPIFVSIAKTNCRKKVKWPTMCPLGYVSWLEQNFNNCLSCWQNKKTSLRAGCSQACRFSVLSHGLSQGCERQSSEMAGDYIINKSTELSDKIILKITMKGPMIG